MRNTQKRKEIFRVEKRSCQLLTKMGIPGSFTNREKTKLYNLSVSSSVIFVSLSLDRRKRLAYFICLLISKMSSNFIILNFSILLGKCRFVWFFFHFHFNYPECVYRLSNHYSATSKTI